MNKTDKLVDATKNLLEACYQADAREELPHEITGALMDATRDALVGASSAVGPKTGKGFEALEQCIDRARKVVTLLQEAGRITPDEPGCILEQARAELARAREMRELLKNSLLASEHMRDEAIRLNAPHVQLDTLCAAVRRILEER